MSGSPAGRVLSLLERVQQHPGLTAPRLASELGVSERTVRRYVATLQELGIPVEASRGRYGGHRLRPGFRMPPLMLTTDEAVAVTLALAVMRGQAPDPDGSAETALAKLVQRSAAGSVEPGRATCSHAVESTERTAGWRARYLTPVCSRRWRRESSNDGAAGCGTARPNGTSTVREINPYGVAVVRGWCYVHGWCHLRQARRTFRIDRIDRVDLLDATFRMPQGLDVVAAVERSLALARTEWPVSLLLDGPLEEVEPWFPRLPRRLRGGWSTTGRGCGRRRATSTTSCCGSATTRSR